MTRRLVAGLTLVAVAIRFVDLGHQSFWVDETVTARLLAKSFPAMLGALPRSESTPPVYYVLAWIWSRVFGSGEVGLRSLSALLGAATIPVVYAAGAALVSRRAGLIVAVLATVSPLLVWYSQEARAYSLYVLLAALSLLFFARSVRQPSISSLVGWAASSGLALATHYFALFLVLGEAAFLLNRQRRRAVWLATASVAAAGLALLPLAIYQAKYGSSSWIRSVGLGLRTKEALAQLVVPSPPSIWSGAGVPEQPGGRWLVAAAVLVAASVAAICLNRSSRQAVLLCIGLVISAAGVPILLSGAAHLLVHGKGDVFLFRNVVDAWLPITIVIAAALTASRRARIPGLVLAVTLCTASAAQLVVNATTSHLQRDDWRLIARETYGGADRAIVLSPSWEVDALTYYEPALTPRIPQQPVRTIYLLARRWTPAYSPVVATLTPPAGFSVVETRTLQNWRLTILRAPRSEHISASQLADVRPRNASTIVLANTRP
jgi:mannosyltransferase